MAEKYIMVTHDKFKFLLTDEQYKVAVQSLMKGDKFLFIQDSMIPLSLAPTILPIQKWKDSENDRLATSSKRICNNCLSVRDNESRACYTCSSRNREKELLPSAPGMYDLPPPHIPEAFKKGLKIKTF